MSISASAVVSKRKSVLVPSVSCGFAIPIFIPMQNRPQSIIATDFLLVKKFVSETAPADCRIQCELLLKRPPTMSCTGLMVTKAVSS